MVFLRDHFSRRGTAERSCFLRSRTGKSLRQFQRLSRFHFPGARPYLTAMKLTTLKNQSHGIATFSVRGRTAGAVLQILPSDRVCHE